MVGSVMVRSAERTLLAAGDRAAAGWRVATFILLRRGVLCERTLAGYRKRKEKAGKESSRGAALPLRKITKIPRGGGGGGNKNNTVYPPREHSRRRAESHLPSCEITQDHARDVRRHGRAGSADIRLAAMSSGCFTRLPEGGARQPPLPCVRHCDRRGKHDARTLSGGPPPHARNGRDRPACPDVRRPARQFR